LASIEPLILLHFEKLLCTAVFIVAAEHRKMDLPATKAKDKD